MTVLTVAVVGPDCALGHTEAGSEEISGLCCRSEVQLTVRETVSFTRGWRGPVASTQVVVLLVDREGRRCRKPWVSVGTVFAELLAGRKPVESVVTCHVSLAWFCARLPLWAQSSDTVFGNGAIRLWNARGARPPHRPVAPAG